MVVSYKHMWIAIPLNLVIVLFVVIMMGLTKIWMFGSPKRERHIPNYSLHVMKQLPPDKPVPKKAPNPYYGMSKNSHNGKLGLPPKAGGYVHNAPHKLSGQQASAPPDYANAQAGYKQPPSQAPMYERPRFL